MFNLFKVLVLGLFLSVSTADIQSEIKTFRIASLANVQQQYNNLHNDAYGHFHRSQTTLRAARQNLYYSAATYPYFRLSDDARKNLTEILASLIYNVIDPAVESIQKTAMSKFYTINPDEKTITEQAFLSVDTQLSALSSMSENCTGGITSRKLTTEYSNYIAAINNCTRFVFQNLREPIAVFTSKHFMALPTINRMVRELNGCSSNFNINRIEACTDAFINSYCQDESCKVNSIITAVKDQAENMMINATSQYNECLSNIKDKLPSNPTFLRDDSCNTTY